MFRFWFSEDSTYGFTVSWETFEFAHLSVFLSIGSNLLYRYDGEKAEELRYV